MERTRLTEARPVCYTLLLRLAISSDWGWRPTQVAVSGRKGRRWVVPTGRCILGSEHEGSGVGKRKRTADKDFGF